jgi:N-acyl-D-aspartate/D-glutamate deacylase
MGVDVTAIRDARVFDGERVWPRASVLIRDGLIAGVGEELALDAGQVAEEVDGGAGRCCQA